MFPATLDSGMSDFVHVGVKVNLGNNYFDLTQANNSNNKPYEM